MATRIGAEHARVARGAARIGRTARRCLEQVRKVSWKPSNVVGTCVPIDRIKHPFLRSEHSRACLATCSCCSQVLWNRPNHKALFGFAPPPALETTRFAQLVKPIEPIQHPCKPLIVNISCIAVLQNSPVLRLGYSMDEFRCVATQVASRTPLNEHSACSPASDATCAPLSAAAMAW